MCCFTHDPRYHDGYGIPYPLARDWERDGCRCGAGGPDERCPRRADGEDLLCLVCRAPTLPPVRAEDFRSFMAMGLPPDRDPPP